MKCSRRELIGWSAALGAGFALRSRASARPRADDSEELVRWIVTTPRDPALSRGARELHAGLDPQRVLGAVLVAAARDIRTDRASFNHAALSVSAIDQLTAGSPLRERQHAALWCLDDFKRTQEAEARTDDWRMAPVESARLPSGAKARAALVDALERWDREAADVALAGWIRSAPLAEVYELVWEYGLRCQANAGHKVIYAALSRRALPLAGEQFAEEVLRSVVSSFCLHGRSPDSEPFETSREMLAKGIHARAERAAADLGPARELLAALRTSLAPELPMVTSRLLADGATHASLWDAIRIAACEVTVAVPGIGPLHALTATNSLHHIGMNAPNERLRQLAVLQASAWIARFHGRLEGEDAKFRIDALEPESSTIEAVLVNGPRGYAQARGAVWATAHEPEAFLRSARALAATKGDEVHEYKLAAAALEEIRMGGAWSRPCVCAALAMHVPAPARAESARLRRIADALATASAR